MYDWPSDLIAETELNPTTLCRLFEVTPPGKATLYFTDHDDNLTVGGHSYKADHSFEPSAIETSIGNSAQNLELKVLFASSQIAYSDAMLGLYQGAVVSILLASYGNVAAGTGLIMVGRVGQFSLPSKLYGIMSILAGTADSGSLNGYVAAEVYTPTCRADFGDARCGIDIEAHGFDFTVESVTDAMTIVSDAPSRHADGFYSLGTLTWATGANAGSGQELAFSLATGSVGLFYPPPHAMQPGDTGRLYQGCAKTLAACVGYANRVNFRGEPFVPGDDYKQVT